MAEVANKVKKIREAVYGHEVRESIATGIEVINDECEDTTAKSLAKIDEMETLKQALDTSETARVGAEGLRERAEGDRQTNTTAAIGRCDSKVSEINAKLANGDFVGAKGETGDTGLTGPQGEPGSIDNARAVDISTSDGKNVQAVLDGLLNRFYPIGSIVEFDRNINPNTTIGGTWSRFGNGQVLVGVNESEVEFNSVKKTGGEKAHQLTIDEVPKHSHAFSFNLWAQNSGYGNVNSGTSTGANRANTTTGGTSSQGDDLAHNNLQPYITIYRWVRTA